MATNEMKSNGETRTYKFSESAVFYKTREEHGCLSNMASGYPLVINRIEIPSSEALYQACRFPSHPDIQEIIIGQRNAMQAKMKSKPHREEKTRKDWNQKRARIMLWCLRVKLLQHEETFGKELKETGEKEIVERSRKDFFWGAKLDEEKETLTGINLLGRLLMQLREEYARTGPVPSVPPPDVPNFLLFNQPIGTAYPLSATPEPEIIHPPQEEEESDQVSTFPFMQSAK